MVSVIILEILTDAADVPYEYFCHFGMQSGFISYIFENCVNCFPPSKLQVSSSRAVIPRTRVRQLGLVEFNDEKTYILAFSDSCEPGT